MTNTKGNVDLKLYPYVKASWRYVVSHKM